MKFSTNLWKRFKGLSDMFFVGAFTWHVPIIDCIAASVCEAARHLQLSLWLLIFNGWIRSLCGMSRCGVTCNEKCCFGCFCGLQCIATKGTGSSKRGLSISTRTTNLETCTLMSSFWGSSPDQTPTRPCWATLDGSKIATLRQSVSTCFGDFPSTIWSPNH